MTSHFNKGLSIDWHVVGYLTLDEQNDTVTAVRCVETKLQTKYIEVTFTKQNRFKVDSVLSA